MSAIAAIADLANRYTLGREIYFYIVNNIMVKKNWHKIDIPKQQTGIHTWSADHAVMVHEGSMTTQGVELPARPWAGTALDDYDFASRYAEAFQATGSFREAFVAMSEGYGELAQSYLDDPIWDWPRDTLRKNGQIVSSPRDIVDTGALRDSYTHEIMEDG